MKRLPFVQIERNRHGTTVYYFRKKGEGARIRLRGEYLSEEFMAAYAAALAGKVPAAPEQPRAEPQTLAWLIARYRESPEWTRLAFNTRRCREPVLRKLEQESGTVAFAEITRQHIAKSVALRAHQPDVAATFKRTISGLLGWAASDAIGLLPVNPTLGVKLPPRFVPKHDDDSEGFPAWTEDDIAAYEARWPLGTRERLWMAVLLYTGLRRADAARLGRQHIRDGAIRLRAAKTGALIHIPVAPELQAAIDACPAGELALIARADGQPFSVEGFGNAMRFAAKAAGVSKSAHGLRKSLAIRLALRGATVPVLNAWLGWRGSKMALHYIEQADKLRLAQQGLEQMASRGKEKQG